MPIAVAGMYNKFQLASKYLHYYLTSSSGRGHGVHSPFVFDFIVNVLRDNRFFYAYEKMESRREQLLQDTREVEVQDYGAGSGGINTRTRKVKDIARWSLKSAKYARLLFRMINYYQPKIILELGTSLGVTTAYLASANSAAKVYTLEGARALATIARQDFTQLGLSNIHLTEGNFDDTLPSVLAGLSTVDFVFIDGNHRKEPTLRYFEWLLSYVHTASVIVFDDIHWSEEMEEAWQVIQTHSSVTCSIDLFFIGIVFFSPDFREQQHFRIRF